MSRKGFLKAAGAGWLVAAYIAGFAGGVAAQPAAQGATPPPGTETALGARVPDLESKARLVEAYYGQGTSDLRAGYTAEAVQSLRLGLAIGTAEPFPLPPSLQVMGDIRFALAFALDRIGQTEEAVAILEELERLSPGKVEVSYLLATLQLSHLNPKLLENGFARLKAIADGPDQRFAATARASAMRFALARALLHLHNGDPGAALAGFSRFRQDFGESPGLDDAENDQFHYAAGIYHQRNGELEAALTELNALLRRDPAFKLKNGLTIQQVVVALDYQAALAALDRGTAGAPNALERLAEMEKMGAGAAPDLLHARAVAHLYLGQREAGEQALEQLKTLDAAYHARITGTAKEEKK